MADYYPLIARAVAGLLKNTGDARRALYERARTVLVAQLRSVNPPLSENDVTRERLALEEALRRVEAESARKTWVDPANGAEQTRVRAPEFPRWDPAPSVREPVPSPTPTDSDADRSLRETAAWANLSTRLKQEEHGAQVELSEEGYFRFSASGVATDRQAAAHPLTEQLHSEVRRKAQALCDRTLRLSNQAGWSGLVEAVGLFTQLAKREGVEVADNISTFWSLSVSLGGFLEQDQEARAVKGGLVEPLEADVAQQLRDLVTTSGPFVRQFPTARFLDDAAREFLSPLEETEPARRFLSSTRQAELIRREDAEVVAVALEAGTREAALSNKARGWATRTARNVAIAMVLFVIGGTAVGFNQEVGASIARDSALARRIHDLVIKAERDLVDLLSNLPADLRASLRTAIESLQRTKAQPVNRTSPHN